MERKLNMMAKKASPGKLRTGPIVLPRDGADIEAVLAKLNMPTSGELHKLIATQVPRKSE
jgi:hypothetical protein